jgi:hypothetical protein
MLKYAFNLLEIIYFIFQQFIYPFKATFYAMNRTHDESHITTAVKKMVAEKYTMTLATASRDFAWASPVYYVFNKNCFYFFSNPESRHIQNALASGQAAAAIYEDSFRWEDIKGVQMSGKIDSISPGPEAINALIAYVKKFPLMQSFFRNGAELHLDGLFSRFKADLYRFSPDLIYYMDNAIDFGFKEKIQIEALGS